MLPLYIHRDSFVHRMPAGAKLFVCLVATTVICFLQPLWLMGATLAGVCGLYLLAHLPISAIFAALKPMLLVSAVIFALQWLLADVPTAVAVVLRIMTLVLLTSLVTLTTPLSTMIEVLTDISRPFARFGVSPPKLALAIALSIRFIPTLLNDMQEIQRARIARGARGASVFALGPLIVKILYMTNALGNAIAARGFESRK